jgi:hypothetical protein
VLEQEGHRLVDLRGDDDVVVVEGQHRPAGLEVEVVDHTGQDGFGPMRGSAHQLCRFGELADGLQGRDEVFEEPARVVVVLIQGQPRDVTSRAGDGGEPLAEQGRLAEARRRRHQEEAWLLPRVEARQQPWPGDEVRAQHRDVHLGPHDSHSPSIGARRRRPLPFRHLRRSARAQSPCGSPRVVTPHSPEPPSFGPAGKGTSPAVLASESDDEGERDDDQQPHPRR